MIYPARGQTTFKGLDKFTDINGHEFWFFNTHFMAFRHRLSGDNPVVLKNTLGNACGRALTMAFGPDPHDDRRLSGPAFAEKFREAFGVLAGIPTIIYDQREPCP